MESLNQEIVKNIKQEEMEVVEQFTIEEFVGDVKHEPERHFVFIMPDDPEIEEIKEVKIVLTKFDRAWKTAKPELFENYFFCDKCDFVTKDLSNFRQHLTRCKVITKCENCKFKSKTGKIKKCAYCDIEFDCKNCETFHIAQVHRKGLTWLCNICEFKTLNNGSLRLHHKAHEKKFSCETCRKNFSVNRYLKVHQQQHRHGVFADEIEVKFECRKCVQSFATKQGLYHHEKYVHIEMKLHCDICGKTSKNKITLRQHMETHFKVLCSFCQKMIFKRRFKEHIEKHSISAKFKCDVCFKVYSSKSKLGNHKKQQHEIDEVQCDLCSKIFQNKLLLRMHMRLHIKVPCPLCKKSYSKLFMNKHMKSIHSSGQKFLTCNITLCRQKLRNIKELREHKEIHIGPNNFKCPKCNHRTKRCANMKDHMRRRHKP